MTSQIIELNDQERVNEIASLISAKITETAKKVASDLLKIKDMKTRDSFIKIRDKLKKYNKEYYNSNPSIDDSEYDDLRKSMTIYY